MLNLCVIAMKRDATIGASVLPAQRRTVQHSKITISTDAAEYAFTALDESPRHFEQFRMDVSLNPKSMKTPATLQPATK